MTALTRPTFLIASLICSMQFVHAQTIQRISGEVLAAQGSEIRVKDKAGQVTALRLGDQTVITTRATTTLDTIAPGSYVGTTASPRPDGTLTASEVHVFAESMRGVGEGHRPMERVPGSTMTNATVTSVTQPNKSGARNTMTNATVASVAGNEGARRMILKYNGGEQTVLVEHAVPVTLVEPGDASLLVPGARVAVTASSQLDGTLIANRITIGKNGYVPTL